MDIHPTDLIENKSENRIRDEISPDPKLRQSNETKPASEDVIPIENMGGFPLPHCYFARGHPDLIDD